MHKYRAKSYEKKETHKRQRQGTLVKVKDNNIKTFTIQQ